jgi:beta-RFAP synthase
MAERPPTTTVVIEAPARLHFGMLDVGGSLGRQFGGIGVAVYPPALRLSARAAPDVVVTAHLDVPASEDAIAGARAATTAAAKRVLAHYHIAGGAHIALHQLLPAHRGLGSGTQLALATGRAVAELYDLPHDALGLAQIVGRARRSAIGTYVFAHGGLVVEGGRRPDRSRPAPLLAHLSIPSAWRCVVTLPSIDPGVSGEAEGEAFAALPQPPASEAERVAHLVLMALLPALVEGDFEEFGAALTEIQDINGRWFAPAQGGCYAPGPSTALVDALKAWGVAGVGQSSWGPAVYALAPGSDASAMLARRIGAAFPTAVVYDAAFSAKGAGVRVEQLRGA